MPPAGEGPAIAVSLDDLIESHEPILRATWSERRSDDDVLILGDVRAPEFARITREHYGA
jgi:hypothetical protein